MNPENEHKLKPYLPRLSVWALSLGTSIGWGSLVVTSNTYLMQAGPLGSTLGMIAGGLIMMLITVNYVYMMSCTPDAGGAYAYARDAFGYDHGFLTSWFLALTYLAVLWANATSLPLFARYFLGGIFMKGKLYSIFGYDVYLGEVLLPAAAILLTAFFCIRGRKSLAVLMSGMVLLFTVGIVVCFAAAWMKCDLSLDPLWVPDSAALSQVVKIACISPWAFIGFENISHFSEEFTFPRRKSMRILTIAVVATTLLYIFVILLSVTAYPPQYANWLDYIRDRGNLSGLDGLPAFYAARHYLGMTGVRILMLSLLALIATSLIGNMLALSRLFYAMGRDRILPEGIGSVNRYGNPGQAILLIAVLSVGIPLIGRTAIGWIVDVTTIGATIVYGFVSASAWKTAKFRGDRLPARTGAAGLVIMVAFGLYLLVPNLFAAGSMETESYFLFVIWAVLGFFFFHAVLKKDQGKRFGHSIIVWVALLSLVLFVSLVWMSQTNLRVTAGAMNNIQDFLSASGSTREGDSLVLQELERVRITNSRSILVVLGVFILSLAVLMNNYVTMSKRAWNSEQELGAIRLEANTDAMTGVRNKRAYTEQEEDMSEQMAKGTLQEMAVVVCDVNGLKHINDTQGHKAGDEYIRAACHLVCDMYAHSPVFRIGGDEFVVLLTGRDYERRDSILAEFNRKVEENIAKEGVVISAGMSVYEPGRDATLHDVFEQADKLMYIRKQQLKQMGARTR